MQTREQIAAKRQADARERARPIEEAARALLQGDTATRYTWRSPGVLRHALAASLMDLGDGPTPDPRETRRIAPPAEAMGVVIHEAYGRALLAFEVPGGPVYGWADWYALEPVRRQRALL